MERLPYRDGAKVLHRLCANAGMTTPRLAREMDVHQSTIKHVLTGRQGPSVGLLDRMLDALGASAEDAEEARRLFEEVRQARSKRARVISAEPEVKRPRRLTLVKPAGSCDGNCAGHDGRIAPGPGERDDDCGHYEECFDAVVFAHPYENEVHCPKACSKRAARGRSGTDAGVGSWASFVFPMAGC